MPIYEYRCDNEKCKTVSFELAVSIAGITVGEDGKPHYVINGEPPVCPGCQTKRISRMYGSFRDNWIGGKPSTGG